MFNPVIDVSKIMYEIKEQVNQSQVKEMEASKQFASSASIPLEQGADKRVMECDAEIERIASFLDHTREDLNVRSDIGVQGPDYSRFPWPLRSIFRLISRAVKKSIKFVIVRQVGFNQMLGSHLKALGEMNDTLNNKANILRQEIASMKAQMETEQAYLKDILSKSQQGLESVEKEIDGIKQSTDVLSGALQKGRNDIEALSGALQEGRDDIEALKENMDKERARLEENFQTYIDELTQENETLKKHRESDRKDMGAMARQIMLSKWKLIDALRKETEKPDDVLTCKICGHAQERSEYETKESKCIFNGGILVRYICPECGVVFGPSKFVDQGQEGIDEDYWVHYLGFSEGDSSYKEEKAFRQLDPLKNKKYLNYGCGKWSKTLQKLRAEGYNVYGYEPYAPEDDNPYLITSKQELAKMRFDGIFSNDVLEHFVDPVKDLEFMRGLLVDENSRMSHCTACYTYKYEHTRFHTHFFLGDSVRIMADKAGLRIVSFIDDMDDHDFLCYVYAPKEIDHSILQYAFPVRHAQRIEDGMAMARHGLICGPYLSLPGGKYSVRVNVDCLDDRDEAVAEYRLTSEKGDCLLQSGILESGINELDFESESEIEAFECVVEAKKGMNITQMELYRKS